MAEEIDLNKMREQMLAKANENKDKKPESSYAETLRKAEEFDARREAFAKLDKEAQLAEAKANDCETVEEYMKEQGLGTETPNPHRLRLQFMQPE